MDVERYNDDADAAMRRALLTQQAEAAWRADIDRIMRADWRSALILRAKFGPRLARQMLTSAKGF